MLDFQLQQMPFRFGLAEGVDPRQAPPGTLLTAENVVWKQSGRLEKRFGTAALVATIIGGGSIVAASRLFARGSELCLIDGERLYAYSPAIASWKDVGGVPEVGLTWSPLTDSASGVKATDAALSAAGLLVHAWVTGDSTDTVTAGNLFVQVLDRVTGAVVIQPAHLDNSVTGVRVHVIGTSAYLVYRTDAGVINGWTLDLTVPEIGVAGTTLRSDCLETSGWDSVVIGTTIVVAYEHTAAAPKLVLHSFDTALAAVASGDVASEAGSAFLSIGLAGADGEQIFVAYYTHSSQEVRFATVDPSTLAEVTAPATVEAVQCRTVTVGRYDATSAVIAYRTRASDASRTSTRRIIANGTSNITTARGTWYSKPCGRPFMIGSRCYLAICEEAASGYTSAFTGANTYLVEVEVGSTGSAASNAIPHRYIGKIDMLTGASPVDFEPPPSPMVVSDTEAAFPSFFLASVPTGFETWRTGLRLVSATVGSSHPADAWRSVTYGSNAFFSAGVLSAYDGRSTFDYGFAAGPSIFSNTASSPLGAIVAGDYLYATSLEYPSATGLLYRSPPAVVAVPVTVAVTPTRETFVVFGTTLSSKQNVATGFSTDSARTVLLPFYRSTVGGSELQRLTVDPTYNWLQNDPLQSALNFVDTRADADIDGLGTALASRPALYTTGGILEDYSPVANVTMFGHVDRLWTLAGDERTWWYSKSFQDDLGVAPGFHPQLRISFDERQTAGATMDNKAVFFSESGVRFMEGVGPAPNGQNSDFQTPSVIQSDVGCVNARSVVGMPDGIMFLSARGLYLLTRGLELVWIGRAIKETLASFPNVTSAVLVAKHNQVRFTCNSVDGASGIVLVFDYVEKQWSTAKYSDGATYGCPIADACMWGGAWTFVTPTGTVYQESATSYLDAGTAWVPMTIETAWIAAAGPLAFQSVRAFSLHGTSHTDHDLTVSVGFNSEASYPQVVHIQAESAVTRVGVEECEISIGTRRKCATIRFKVADALPSAGTLGTGRGPALDMMGIEVGIKRGFAGQPATRKG